MKIARPMINLNVSQMNVSQSLSSMGS